MRTLLSALLVVASMTLLLAPTPARACSCMVSSLDEQIDQAATIFEGRVVSIEPAGSAEEGPTMLRVTFDVVRGFKGRASETMVLTTADNSAACGYAFTKDETYLVYAHDAGDSLGVGLCSRTQPIAQASEDLAKLGAGVTPVDSPTEAAAPKPAERSPRGSRGGCGSCSTTSGAPLEAGIVFVAMLALLLRRRRA